MADLQQRGLLTGRAGGGVFVADVLGSAFSDALVQPLREGVFYNRQIMFKQRTTREAQPDRNRAINCAPRPCSGARCGRGTSDPCQKNALRNQQRAGHYQAIALQRLAQEQRRT